MSTPLPEAPVRLADLARTRIADRDGGLDLGNLVGGTCLGGAAARLAGCSVMVATAGQIASAAVLVELDGVARRLVLVLPDVGADHLATIVEDAEVDTIVTDQPERFTALALPIVLVAQPIAPAAARPPRGCDTEWVMLTSGTSGRPKLVAHTLAALTGAITPAGAGDAKWATFYDIRRYGGLQIFLRAILGGADLICSSEGELIGRHLARLGAAGVTHISGTPSHWRRVLMSHERGAMAPRYIRLSGEIADQMVLDGLRAAYPAAGIGHAYASTEAGVGFAVDDGLEGFPAALVDTPAPGLAMKVEDGSLRIRSTRAASRYLGASPPALADADGWVDTGDLVERRGDRYLFVGRRGGIINVGGLKVNPEEVEAAINAHAAVRMSLVQGKRNPLTGAIVMADVVLVEPDAASEALKTEILDLCREKLDRQKVPAILRFVSALALTPGGKLSRVPPSAKTPGGTR